MVDEKCLHLIFTAIPVLALKCGERKKFVWKMERRKPNPGLALQLIMKKGRSNWQNQKIEGFQCAYELASGRTITCVMMVDLRNISVRTRCCEGHRPRTTRILGGVQSACVCVWWEAGPEQYLKSLKTEANSCMDRVHVPLTTRRGNEAKEEKGEKEEKCWSEIIWACEQAKGIAEEEKFFENHQTKTDKENH